MQYNQSRVVRLAGIICLIMLLMAKQNCYAEDSKSNKFKLPQNKLNIQICHEQALQMHPGKIEIQKMLHTQPDLILHFVITAKDGAQWLVTCDESTGKIVSDLKLED